MMSESEVLPILEACIGMSSTRNYSLSTIKQISRQQQIDGLNISILSIRKWSMHAQVADNFYYHSNPKIGNNSDPQHVFLVGDAAHRFPPAGGFGMNTGLQDAHNLCFKLASVTHTPSSHTNEHAILSLYNTERRKVALENTHLSMNNYGKTARTAAALGVDPQLAKLAVSIVDNSMLPQSVKRVMLDNVLKTGLAPLQALASPSNIYSIFRTSLLRRQIDKGDMLPLIFPQFDLDFQYEISPLLGSATSSGTVNTQQAISNLPSSSKCVEPSPEAYVAPRLRAGARVPHCWFELLPTSDASTSKDIARTLISSTSLPRLSHQLRLNKAHNSLDDPQALTVLAPGYTLIIPSSAYSAWRENLGILSGVDILSLTIVIVHGAPSSVVKGEAPTHLALQELLQRPYHMPSTDHTLSTVPVEHNETTADKYIDWSCLSDDCTSPPLYYSSNSKCVEVVDLTGRWSRLLQRGIPSALVKKSGENRVGTNIDSQSRAVLLRPDGHVAAVVDASDRELFLAYFKG